MSTATATYEAGGVTLTADYVVKAAGFDDDDTKEIVVVVVFETSPCCDERETYPCCSAPVSLKHDPHRNSAY